MNRLLVSAFTYIGVAGHFTEGKKGVLKIEIDQSAESGSE